MTSTEFILIGIDGGATKVSAWQIQYNTEKIEFALGNLNATKSYSELPGYLPEFKPLPVTEQLAQKEQGQIKVTTDEKQQGAVYVEACALVIEQIVQKSGQHSVLFGLGMPGLKTPDQRGIEVVANGPRIPDYARMLEERLQLAQIHIVHPLKRIGSDADYCGIGENFAREGLFKDVSNAYYLGGGTGVADALKLNGKLIPFDQIKNYLAKTWEMKNEQGQSLEQFASAGGMQRLYAEISGQEVAELNRQHIYPLQIAEMAANGESSALKTFKLIVKNLSALLYERIVTLYAGWQNPFSFINPNRPPLQSEHPFLKTLLQRIILGQRLGELLQSDSGQKILKQPLMENLDQLIRHSTHLDEKAKTHYRNLDNIITVSKLREAPALGAGIDAYLNFKK